MAERQKFIFDLRLCHGIDASAMASMLSKWVITTAERDDWIGNEAYHSFLRRFRLSPTEFEKVTYSILDALEDSGLASILSNKSEHLKINHCEVNRHHSAYLELEWV